MDSMCSKIYISILKNCPTMFINLAIMPYTETTPSFLLTPFTFMVSVLLTAISVLAALFIFSDGAWFVPTEEYCIISTNYASLITENVERQIHF